MCAPSLAQTSASDLFMKDRLMRADKIISAILRPYWRMRRGLTLGAQACVLDETSRVLLIKHGYRPGWHFPGGGVEWGETVEFALGRELHEETGVELTAPAELHGLFANFTAFPGDHVALFLVRAWRRPAVPAANAEIIASAWYARDALPADTTPAVGRRLAEIFGGEVKRQDW